MLRKGREGVQSRKKFRKLSYFDHNKNRGNWVIRDFSPLSGSWQPL